MRCKWMYNIKYRYDDTLDRYKASLQRDTQTYEIDYEEEFVSMTKMNTIMI